MEEAKCPFCEKVNFLPDDISPEDRSNWECIWCHRRFGDAPVVPAPSPPPEPRREERPPTPPREQHPPGPRTRTAPSAAHIAAVRAKAEARLDQIRHQKKVVMGWLCVAAALILIAIGVYFLRGRTTTLIRAQIQQLATDDDTSRHRTVAELADYGKRAVPELIDAVEDPDPTIRRGVIETLKAIGDERALAPLLDRLRNDEDADVRAAAADALEAFGGRAAIRALIAALDDAASGVRAAAIRSLGKLKVSQAVPPLIQILRTQRDPMTFVRAAAAEALGNIGGDDAVKALKDAMTFDPNESVAEAAEDAYNKLASD